MFTFDQVVWIAVGFMTFAIICMVILIVRQNKKK